MPNSAQLVSSCVELLGGDRVDDGQRAVGGGNAVVGGGDGEIGTPDLEAALAQAVEGLRRSDFVDQVQVDEEQRGRAGLLVDDVGIPKFFDDGTWHKSHSLSVGRLPSSTSWRAC